MPSKLIKERNEFTIRQNYNSYSVCAVARTSNSFPDGVLSATATEINLYTQMVKKAHFDNTPIQNYTIIDYGDIGHDVIST